MICEKERPVPSPPPPQPGVSLFVLFFFLLSNTIPDPHGQLGGRSKLRFLWRGEDRRRGERNFTLDLGATGHGWIEIVVSLFLFFFIYYHTLTPWKALITCMHVCVCTHIYTYLSIYLSIIYICMHVCIHIHT